MATKRKPAKPAAKSTASRGNERGSTLYGVLAGLLIGLVVAAGVAFYVTQAPMPFVDKATREAQQSKLPDLSHAPDPNAGLYGRDGPAGTAPTGPAVTGTAPLPGAPSGSPAAKPGNPQGDELGALIASLPPKSEPAAPSARPSTPPANGGASSAKPSGSPAASGSTSSAGSAASTTKAAPPPASTGTYFLQAGAYRVSNDAESLRARILLLGLPVAIQRAEVNNMQISRVRVGPFARLDDMNRARARLGEEKIEASVVRQQ